MWGPRSIAKLVQITPITMVYGTYNYSIHGAYKPTYILGASHCVVYWCVLRREWMACWGLLGLLLIVSQWIPSGKLTVCELENHHFS